MTPLDGVRALLFKLMSKGVVHQKACAPVTESAAPPEELCAAGLGTSSGNARCSGLPQHSSAPNDALHPTVGT